MRINITKAGKAYQKKHGSLGASGTNDDAPLVDTGHLRQAVTTDTKDIDKGTVYVGVASGKKDSKGNSPGIYAAAHEFGYAPKNIPARPFLRPAAYESREDIRNDIAEAVKEELWKTWTD